MKIMYVNIKQKSIAFAKYIILSQFCSLKTYRLAKCHNINGNRTHGSVSVESGIDPVPSSCKFFIFQLKLKTT